MWYYPASALINCVTGVVIFILCLVKNPWSSLNRTLSYFSASIAIWSLFYFFWQISTNAEQAKFWCVMLMAGAIMIPCALFHFSVTLIEQYDRYKKQVLMLYGIGIIFLLFDVTTSAIVSHVEPLLGFPFWPIAGWLYPLYLAYTLGLIGYSLYLIYKHWATLNGVKRNQIKYVLLGLFLGYVGGATNYFLWYRIPVLPVGNIGASTIFILSFYAIVKYQLMDIRIAITRFTIFFLVYLPLLGIPYYVGHKTNSVYISLSLMWLLATIGPLVLRQVQKKVEAELFKQKELLYKASIVDPLTSAYNRAFFEGRFMIEIQKAQIAKSPLTLMVIDVDKFKNVNDSFGHQAGDQLLKMVSAILKEVVREADMVIRFGGDEFVVILLGTGLDHAKRPAERIQQLMHQRTIHVQDENKMYKIGTTLSIGIAELRPNESEKELFERADQAVYQSKGKGGNSISVSD